MFSPPSCANKVIFFITFLCFYLPFAQSNQMWEEGHWLGNTSSGLQSLLAVNMIICYKSTERTMIFIFSLNLNIEERQHKIAISLLKINHEFQNLDLSDLYVFCLLPEDV